MQLRSKLIYVIGFITILALLLVVILSWIRTATLDSNRLHSLVQKQLQTRLTATMLTATQSRGLSLYRMTTVNDPFEQDDAYINFRKQGEAYLKARDQILAGEMSADEKVHLRQVDKLAEFGGAESERIAQLISDGQNNRALHLLNNSILPNRIKMTHELRDLFQSQRGFVEQQLSAAAKDQRYTNFLIAALVSVVLLLGLLMAFAVRRIDRTEHDLLEQGKRVRALYEASSISGLTHEEQVNETLKLGCRLLGMETGKVCHSDAEKGVSTYIHTVTTSTHDVKTGLVIPMKNTFCSLCYDSNEPIMIHHVKNSPYAHYPFYEFTHLESYIAAPIWVNGEKYGAISFSSSEPKTTPFNQQDKELVKLIANWVSVALERQIAQQINIARQSAEAANDTKSAFLANMSHELRTPLNAIIGYNELMRDEVMQSGDDHYLGDIEKINNASRHLLNLINDILDLSKIESGKLQVNPEYFALKPFISELISTVTSLVERKNNTLQVVCDNNLGIMRSDITKLRQVLINLIGNASKFTENGRITLTVTNFERDGESWASFQVCDTGIGISDEHMNKVFTAFAQADHTITAKYGGTGLGLAISKNLCELIGGTIKVESIKDVGSVFTVNVPMVLTKSGNTSQPLIANHSVANHSANNSTSA